MASTVWRGYVTFGLISIPVRLFRAARAERVSFRRLHRQEPNQTLRIQAPQEPSTLRQRAEVHGANVIEPEPIEAVQPILSPVRQASVRHDTGELLPQQTIVKGYEYEPDRFVEIKPEELKSAAPKTSTQMEIQEFIRISEIDPVYFETSYYVTPEEAGEKAYALLYRALQTTALVAIAQFAMHGREHVVVLRPAKTGILAHTMFFVNEVRVDEEYRADTSLVAQRELELAETLIRSLAGPFEPEKYRDVYRERLESIIADKVKGEPAMPVEQVQRPAEVVDITDALRRSLANLKKPPESEKPRAKAAQSPERAKKTASSRGRS